MKNVFSVPSVSLPCYTVSAGSSCVSAISDRRYVITGSSRGIGRACALVFAENGYHVFINCSKSMDSLEETRRAIESSGGTCTMLPGDVSDPDAVRAIFRQIESICPGPDVLINNAGISRIGLLQDLSFEDWNRLIAVNLSGVFYCCKLAIPGMIRKKQGKIINISSVWGVCGASCEAAYSASKGGVNALTMALAKELAPSNIQVNAIACGAIDTDMNRFLAPEERQALLEEIPMGRMGTPEEAAQLILKLLESPAYLTGQIIRLDGGWI